MKKSLLLVLAITLISGFAMAGDEGIGITVGAEFGINEVNKPNSGDMYPYLMPMLIYGNSFFNDAFDVYAELDYTFGFTKDSGDYPQDLYFDLALGFNLKLGDLTTLSFLLENENGLVFAPKSGLDFGDRIWGTLRPGILFNQSINNFGDLYAQIDAPFMYVQGWGDSDIPFGLDFSLGWNSTFGLGLKAKAHTLLLPKDWNMGYTGLDLIASFETGPIYAGIEVRIGRYDSYPPSSFFDGSGIKTDIAIIPEFQFNFDFGLSLYAKCAFGAIGGSGDVIISPAVGVQFTF